MAVALLIFARSPVGMEAVSRRSPFPTVPPASLCTCGHPPGQRFRPGVRVSGVGAPGTSAGCRPSGPGPEAQSGAVCPDAPGARAAPPARVRRRPPSRPPLKCRLVFLSPFQAFQLGPTEASYYWVYWVPTQYVDAIKDTVLGKWQYF